MGGEGAGATATEVVVFRLGADAFVAPREDVRAIRHSPRVRHAREGRLAAEGLPVVSLSEVLGLGRDTAVDRRVLEVDHWGARLGLEVTAIEGIRRLRVGSLHALPPLVRVHQIKACGDHPRVRSRVRRRLGFCCHCGHAVGSLFGKCVL